MRPDAITPFFYPLSTLPGFTQTRLEKLTSLLKTKTQREICILDMVFHLPIGCHDRRFCPPISQLCPKMDVTLRVEVIEHAAPPPGSKRPYTVICADHTGQVALVFFRANARWLAKILPVGAIRYIGGKVDFWNESVQMAHPRFIATQEDFQKAKSIEPIYPLVNGLTQKTVADVLSTVFSYLPKPASPGTSTGSVSGTAASPGTSTGSVSGTAASSGTGARRSLDKGGSTGSVSGGDHPSISWDHFLEALHAVHYPKTPEDCINPNGAARQSLAYHEIFANQLALLLMREKHKKMPGRAHRSSGVLSDKLRALLPFSLTEGQEKALKEITKDLSSPRRMLRLLQGDVGSGKTIVSLFSMCHVFDSGAQSALMAPTEILARQHFDTLSPLCAALGLTCLLLTGRLPVKDQREAHERLLSGEIDCVVGTHALFQEAVQFRNLGLVVIDEQHRFGVAQRIALSEKGTHTDVLFMSATPIPRSLVLTRYGDMDLSIIHDKPKGRQTIDTRVMPLERLDAILARLNHALKDGQKIYWICPLVYESEKIDLAACAQRHAFLQERLCAPVRLVHGQMKKEEKQDAMQAFAQGTAQVLVATTVVEVGVDVPDATIMVIEHAERFGLSQLHQLRGRVGRGARPSVCLLLYKAPADAKTLARLQVMRRTNDGFEIAREDLAQRGEGDILGTRQSGLPPFRLTQFPEHIPLIAKARKQAKALLSTDPALTASPTARLLLHLFEVEAATSFL